MAVEDCSVELRFVSGNKQTNKRTRDTLITVATIYLTHLMEARLEVFPASLDGGVAKRANHRVGCQRSRPHRLLVVLIVETLLPELFDMAHEFRQNVLGQRRKCSLLAVSVCCYVSAVDTRYDPGLRFARTH